MIQKQDLILFYRLYSASDIPHIFWLFHHLFLLTLVD